jgi:hypothetical protein
MAQKLELVYRPLYFSQTRKRFGYSFTYRNSGLTYQYPLQDMSYLNNAAYIDGTCNDKFDMRCTNLYKELYDDPDAHIIYKRELGKFIACSKITNGMSCE